MEELRIAQNESDLFWQLTSFIKVIKDIRKDDSAALAEVEERAREMEAEAYAYKCQRTSTHELKALYHTFLDMSNKRGDMSEATRMHLDAIQAELKKRGLPADWYIEYAAEGEE